MMMLRLLLAALLFGCAAAKAQTVVPGGPAVGQILGTTTNDNASSGNVGQYVSSNIVVGSAVTLTTSTTADITSISLTAGDWDVSGTICYNLGATTSVTALLGSVVNASITNSTLGINGTLFSISMPATVIGNTVDTCYSIAPWRASLASTSSYFLTTTTIFTVSTAKAYGLLSARRRR